MKTTTRSPLSSSPCHLAAIVATGVTLALGSASAQVVIEGGPGVIQISDRDGKPEPVVPGGVPNGAPVPFDKDVPAAGALEAAGPRAVTMRPDPQSPVTVRVAVKPAPPAKTPEPGAVIAAVPEVDVAAAKRKAEIIRELGIADSGTGAKVSILTENLYVKSAATVDPLADPKLALLAEFIRLTNHAGVAITYHYSPDLHQETLAWDRSVSFVEWMKEKGKLPETTFTVNEPVKMVETPDVSVAVDPATVPPFGKVEVVINYR